VPARADIDVPTRPAGVQRAAEPAFGQPGLLICADPEPRQGTADHKPGVSTPSVASLGGGALDDRDGGGRPHSPVELPLPGAIAGAAGCLERAQVVS